MTNPFKLLWASDWTFQIVHMDGGIHLEGYGLGLCLRAPLQPNETPMIAADKLILDEDRNRKSLFRSWKYQQSNSKELKLHKFQRNIYGN